MNNILMIDDDLELAEMVQEYLAGEGFEVGTASDGTSGLERALSGDYELVLLDVMLPGINGFEVLRRLRSSSAPEGQVPALMLTARRRRGPHRGIGRGADDYLAKPFDERELVARMRAILRRATPASTVDAAPAAGQARETMAVGDLEVDLGSRVVHCGGTAIILTALEFDLLARLLRKPARW